MNFINTLESHWNKRWWKILTVWTRKAPRIRNIFRARSVDCLFVKNYIFSSRNSLDVMGDFSARNFSIFATIKSKRLVESVWNRRQVIADSWHCKCICRNLNKSEWKVENVRREIIAGKLYKKNYSCLVNKLRSKLRIAIAMWNKSRF